MLSTSIKKLVTYGLETGLLPECETSYATNLILDLFHEEYFMRRHASCSAHP